MRFVFKDIVDIKYWQTIQDHFAKVLRISLGTLDVRGRLISRPSIISSVCDQLVKESPAGIEFCQRYQKEALAKADKNWRQGYQCFLGLHCFLVPLRLEEETLAYLLVGPVILGRQREARAYMESAKHIKVDPIKFLDGLRQVKTLTFYGIKSILELLHDIGSCICQLNYQNAELKALIPQAPVILEKIHAFYVERLLNALLEISYNFAKADRASIMLLDKETDELYIKVARGLNQEIIDTTRIKVGQGLSGMVAKSKEPLFIDHKITDQKILKNCLRSQIKSSIVIPLESGGELLGVMNIGSYGNTSDSLFTYQKISTIDKLTELVQAVLTDLSDTSLKHQIR